MHRALHVAEPIDLEDVAELLVDDKAADDELVLEPQPSRLTTHSAFGSQWPGGVGSS